jgi:putative NADH-flavin reductase
LVRSTDRLVTDAQGESRVSAEDYTAAMIDELGQPQHIRQRFIVAY